MGNFCSLFYFLFCFSLFIVFYENEMQKTIKYYRHYVAFATYVFIISLFQFMHPEWDATYSCIAEHNRTAISIHASRVGCNIFRLGISYHIKNFNSCIPSGMQRGNNYISGIDRRFQFMHPEWDATARFR